MSDPYLGEIQLFGFPFAPKGWAMAAGQLLPVGQNAALFSLIGNLYGGDGRSTFELPNLASCQAGGAGQGPGLDSHPLGEQYGDFTVSLNESQLPQHNHGMAVATASPNPTVQPDGNSTLGVFGGDVLLYATPTTPAVMHPAMILATGNAVPHENCQPYLGINFCIALAGTFPQFP